MKNHNIFIERREQGDFAVRRQDSKRASAVESTQRAAIQRALEIDSKAVIRVERVRCTTVGSPDKWRKLS